MIAEQKPQLAVVPTTCIKCNKEITRKFCFVKVHIIIASPCGKTSDFAVLGAFSAMAIYSASYVLHRNSAFWRTFDLISIISLSTLGCTILVFDIIHNKKTSNTA